jgi:hypothetical protein|tara:strand:+ start:454 stop:1086 length:633 start_codon:yes stop_codon:yes gene_type:complete
MSIVTYNNRSIANISAIPGAAKSLTHIKTLTASSSGTLDFLNGSDDVVLDSTYPIYLFKFVNIHPATNRAIFQFQADTGTNTNYNITATSTYFNAYHKEDDSATALAYNESHDDGQSTSFLNLTVQNSNNNDSGSSGTLHIFNPSSTTFVKHFISRFSHMYEQSNGDNYAWDNNKSGYFNTTTALTRFQFKYSTGNIDAGTIKLYGIKDS